MSREIEARLVAVLEAAGAPLPLDAIYERFADDFDDEADLAKCLVRLVGDTRIARSIRKRANGRTEFVYGTPSGARNVIPASRDEAAPAVSQTAAEPANEEVNDMAKKERTEKVFAAIENAKAWISKEKISKATGVKPGPLGFQLRKLIAAKRVQAHGNSTRRVYGGIGLKPPADDAGEPTARAAAKKGRKAKGARRGAVQTSARVERIVTPPPKGGLPRFGYFSDGSLLLECAGCTGTLSQEDLVALRDFTRRFEEGPPA